MVEKNEGEGGSPDALILIDAVRYYLREVVSLRAFGLNIKDQPVWVEESLWDYACQAAERRRKRANKGKN